MTILLFILELVFTQNIPSLNERIIRFVDSNKGRQVGSGECWDLAAGALEFAGAYLDRSTKASVYMFGKAMNPRHDIIYPGDIIQFENVIIQFRRDNNKYIEKMPHHTAIIYTVNGPGRYLIAHQNNSKTGKRVGITYLDLKHIKQGEFIIYRPVAKE